MKKFLILSILVTILGACSHKGHHGTDGCKSGKPCPMESKESQKSECEDCKKTK